MLIVVDCEFVIEWRAVEKSKTKRALDVASDIASVGGVVADVAVAGGTLAGGKLLWAAVTSGIGRRRHTQAEQYFERVAAALGEEDIARLASDLTEDVSAPCWDTIEEGFRAILMSVHEDAKRAIAALVADYVKVQLRPDREYQLAGELLARADAHLLQVFLRVAQELAEVRDVQLSQYPNAIVQGCNLVRGPGAGVLGDVWMCCHLTTDDGSHTVSSTGCPLPEKLAVALGLLERFEFGSVADPNIRLVPGYATQQHPAVHGVMFHTGSDAEARLLRLRRYLRYALE